MGALRQVDDRGREEVQDRCGNDEDAAGHRGEVVQLLAYRPPVPGAVRGAQVLHGGEEGGDGADHDEEAQATQDDGADEFAFPIRAHVAHDDDDRGDQRRGDEDEQE